MRNKSALDITVLGTGNVGTALAVALEQAGHRVHEVFSRKLAHAEKLATKLYNAEATAGYEFSESKSGIFIIALPDNVIYDVVCRLQLPADALLLHTSGAQSIDLLDPYAGATGVLYPLQTFVKGTEADFRQIPLLIEASAPEALVQLAELAQSLSLSVVEANHEKRKLVHLAAVFSSNFVNRMLTVAKDLSEEASVDFKLLFPLIRETVEKALKHGPEKTLTGPARRKDTSTLEAHRLLLQDYAELLPIYNAVTENILQFSPEE